MNEKLAIQRTKLANERTLLSYIRTSLVMFAGGGTILKFAPQEKVYLYGAFAVVVLGIAFLILGYYLFLKNRRIILSGNG